jgi:hypothetical protein
MRYLILIGCLLCCGCLDSGNLIKKKDTSNPSVNVVQDSSAIFQSLADSIDNGTLKDSATMARVIVIYKRNGWITDAGVTSFDSAFPDAAKATDLTAADSAKLRAIK